MEEIKCPACGSPNVEQIGANQYRCPYCGNSFATQHLTTATPQPPSTSSFTAELNPGEEVLYEADYVPTDTMYNQAIKDIIIGIVLLFFMSITIGLFIPVIGTVSLLGVAVWEIAHLFMVYRTPDSRQREIRNQTLVVTNKRIVIRSSEKIMKEDNKPIWKRRTYRNVDMPFSEYWEAFVEDFEKDYQCGSVVVKARTGRYSRAINVKDPYFAIKRMEEIIKGQS